MRQTVTPGGTIEALTPDEAAELLQANYRQDVEERVRAAGTIALDVNGNGTEEVYNPPVGFEFEARRISLDLSTSTDPATGNVTLNAAGKTVEYLRSGTRIEWGQPAYGAAVQVPGVQSWGDEQGPYIRNGEVFEVRVRGLTASATLDVTVEGILRRPAQPATPPHKAAMREAPRAQKFPHS
jgi:hypothetical protein